MTGSLIVFTNISTANPGPVQLTTNPILTNRIDFLGVRGFNNVGLASGNLGFAMVGMESGKLPYIVGTGACFTLDFPVTQKVSLSSVWVNVANSGDGIYFISH